MMDVVEVSLTDQSVKVNMLNTHTEWNQALSLSKCMFFKSFENRGGNNLGGIEIWSM